MLLPVREEGCRSRLLSKVMGPMGVSVASWEATVGAASPGLKVNGGGAAAA